MEYKSATKEYRCDACAKMLVGYEKNVFRSENYMSIKGKISLQLVNPDNGDRYWVNVIPPQKTILIVCDLNCLNTYIQYQHAQYLKTREGRLRSSAGTPPKPMRFHKWMCNCETCTRIREGHE